MLMPFLAPGMVRGFKSFPAASSLTPDFAALLGNTRLGNQGIQARNGNVSVSTSLSGIVRGVYSCSLDGTPTIFAATWDGSTKVSIYKSTDDGATWTNISPSSGKYGDTRLAGSASSGPVYFECVKDNAYGGTNYDVVVIQNGADTPRIYAQSVMSIQNQPQAITNTSAIQQRWGFANFFPVESFASQTFTNTGATPMVLTNPAGAYINLNVPSGASANGTATVDWSLGGSLDFSKSTQFVMITDQFKSFTVTSYASATGIITFPANSFNATGLVGLTCDVIAGTGAGQSFTVQANTATTITPTNIPTTILDNTSVVRVPIASDPQLLYQHLKVSFTDNVGVTATIFDPSTQVGSIVAATYPSTVSLTGLQVGYALPTGGTIDYAHITKVVFTYLPAAAIPTDLQIYVMAAGGETQGGARFGLAYHSSGPRGTGPGLVITNAQASPMGDIGSGDGITNLTLLENQAFYYDYEVRAVVPNATNVSQGLDTLLIFRQDVGQSGFYYCQQGPVATYSAGTWTANPSNPLVFGRQISANYDLSGLVNFAQPLPSAGNTSTPIGTAMLSIDGRNFVCGGSTLWISEYGQPFLFSLAQRFFSPGQPDPLSGTTILKSGETLQQIVAIGSTPTSSSSLGGPLDGTGTVYFWTDKNFFKILGFSAQGLDQTSLVGTHGTLSPNSVARNRTGIYWLDNYGQVCYYTAGTSMIYGVSIPDQQINVISLYKVDNEIPYIPGNTGSSPYNRKQFAMGVCNNNRYYLAYTKSGGTANVQALVFCEQLGTFDSLDDFAYNGTTYSAEFMLPYYSASAGRVKTLYFSPASTTTNVLEHEVPGNTNTVNFKFTTRQIFDNFANLVEIDTVTVGISSDNAAGFALTVDRYYITQLGQTTRTSTLNFLSQGGTPSYQVLTDAPIGDTGITAQLSIYGLVPGSTTFLSLNAVVERTKTTGYVRST